MPTDERYSTSSGDHAPQYLIFNEIEYILVSDVHERRAHLRDSPTALDAMIIPKEGTVKWDLVTRYDRLEQGKRSTCVEVRLASCLRCVPD